MHDQNLTRSTYLNRLLICQYIITRGHCYLSLPLFITCQWRTMPCINDQSLFSDTKTPSHINFLSNFCNIIHLLSNENTKFSYTWQQLTEFDRFCFEMISFPRVQYTVWCQMTIIFIEIWDRQICTTTFQYFIENEWK